MNTEKKIHCLAWAVSQAIGDFVDYFEAPASGFVDDIQLSTQTLWAGATNKLIVEVGTAADPDLYGELRSGVDAAASARSARYRNVADDTIIHQTTNKFNKGDLVKITVTAPAGGGAAGVGRLRVYLAIEG